MFLRIIITALAAVLALAACKEDSLAKAQFSDCDGLDRRLEDLFARAGNMRRIELQWQRDIDTYGLKREPYAAVEIGGKRAAAALDAVEALVDEIGYNRFQRDQAEEFGSLLTETLVAFDGQYALRELTDKFFTTCSLEVGEYIVSGSNWNRLHGLYQSPPR